MQKWQAKYKRLSPFIPSISCLDLLGKETSQTYKPVQTFSSLSIPVQLVSTEEQQQVNHHWSAT